MFSILSRAALGRNFVEKRYFKSTTTIEAETDTEKKSCEMAESSSKPTQYIKIMVLSDMMPYSMIDWY